MDEEEWNEGTDSSCFHRWKWWPVKYRESATNGCGLLRLGLKQSRYAWLKNEKMKITMLTCWCISWQSIQKFLRFQSRPKWWTKRPINQNKKQLNPFSRAQFIYFFSGTFIWHVGKLVPSAVTYYATLLYYHILYHQYTMFLKAG